MATKLQLYNLALSHMKATALAAVDEAREARYTLDTWWDITVAEMLEAGFWKFALRTVSITENTSVTPEFGYSSVFDKPNDWVRTYLVSQSEMLNPPLDDWLEETQYFHANASPLYLRYLSNASTHGMDMEQWTSRFNIALSYKLAAYCCPTIMGSSDSEKERLKKDAADAVSSALSFEALREPNKRPPDGQWNKARFGRRGRSDGWRYA